MQIRGFSAAGDGTSVLDYLPTLVTGASNVVGATGGIAKQLPPGSIQLSGRGAPIQQAPPVNWMPILLIGGGLIALSVIISRK